MTASLPASRHIVIVAGEESGDQHAAALIQRLRQKDPRLTISGLGGHHMQKAGAEIIFPLAHYGVTGLTEVLRSFTLVKKAMKLIQKHLEVVRPTLLILVDYPGFNLRLAQFAKTQLALKVVYYISPQIWAWKPGRIHTIKKYVDFMACILPFEKKIYEDAGVPAAYVGHPLLEKIPQDIDPLAARHRLGLRLKPKIIALLPGSRTHEIHRHMPVFKASIIRLAHTEPDLEYLIPVADALPPDILAPYLQDLPAAVHVIRHTPYDAIIASDAAIVASGTAALECALLQKPHCIIYKVSRLTAMIAARVMRVPYLGLTNLLAGRMVVPELLQAACSAERLESMVHALLYDKNFITTMQSELQTVTSSLSCTHAEQDWLDTL